MSFDKKVYRVEEEDTSVMPILLLDKPPTCCITIRARLENYNVSRGGLRTIYLSKYRF